MCACKGTASPTGCGSNGPTRETYAGVSAIGATRLGVVRPKAPYEVAAVVRVDGAASVEIRSLGVTVQSASTLAAGSVSITLSGAVLSTYELWVMPTSSTVTVEAAELAAS